MTPRFARLSSLRFIVASSTVILVSLSVPTLAGPAVVPTEICDNCFDDDGNMLIDREDAMCIAPANGANAGLGDESDAKADLKCQKAMRQVPRLREYGDYFHISFKNAS